MEIGIPVVQHVPGHVDRADQFRKILAGKGVVTAIDLAQQILTGHRHVLRIGGAQVIVALVGAGAAFDAGIQEDLQGTVFALQFSEFFNRDLFPVVHQLAGETQRFLKFRFGDKRFDMRCCALVQVRDLRNFF